MKKFVFTCFVVITLASGCKKEKKSDDPVPQSNGEIEMERITRHQWVIYKLEVSGTDVWYNNFVIKECQRDDSYRFYKSGTLIQYENANVCSGGQDSTTTTWGFYQGRQKLIGTIFGITDTLDIISLQDTTMEFFVNYQGSPSKFYLKKK